jgi:basic membrane protein A
MKKIAVIFLSLVLLFSLVGCGNKNAGKEIPGNEAKPAEAEKVKVALLLPGNINDAGWNAGAYAGIEEAKAKFGVETAYTESVPLAEAEATIRDYANRGYNLIVCHGDEFGDAVKNVAPEFPKVKFAISNSDVRLENAVGMDVVNEEPGYIAGFALGLITKTNKCGYVSSTEILPMKRTETGFRQGLKDSNPNAEAIVAYVGSGDDAAKGKETALALFDKGVDCVYQYAQGSGIGVIQAAQEKKIPIVVTSPGQVKMAPEVAAFSVKNHIGVNITAAVEADINGKFNGDTQIIGTFASGLYRVTDINSKLFTPEQTQKILDQIEKIKQGNLVVNTKK